MKLIYKDKEVHPGETIHIPYELETPFATIHTLAVELNDNTIPRLIEQGVITAVKDTKTRVSIEHLADAEEIFAAALINLFESWRDREQED